MILKNIFISLLLTLIFSHNLLASRECAVCGTFYPKEKKELSQELKTLLQNTKTFPKQNINALIVPHAGYIYSASTAAIAYKTLHKKYKNIFIIGSSHYLNTNNASINTQAYETPLGIAKVNDKIISSLMQDSQLFVYNKEMHKKEHSIEVQLPFLQTLYGDNLQIIPIVIATSNTDTIRNISLALEPYFNDENLFIISSDFSHYPNYSDANSLDANTLQTISLNSSKQFIKLLKKDKGDIKNLQTIACGWSSLLMLLNFTLNKDYKYELLAYSNSGDSDYGDKKRVVGYGAMRVYKEKEFSLSLSQKKELLDIAKISLYEAITNKKKFIVDASKLFPILKHKLGAFVTLYKDSKLRGCIGQFEPNKPLYDVIIDMAIASALDDTRFKQVDKSELKDIEIKISVLSPRKRISSLDEIIIGKHGIYVKQGLKHGTYLPHVATQMGWNTEEFVKECAVNKAKINYKSLKDIELYIYESIVFK